MPATASLKVEPKGDRLLRAYCSATAACDTRASVDLSADFSQGDRPQVSDLHLDAHSAECAALFYRREHARVRNDPLPDRLGPKAKPHADMAARLTVGRLKPLLWMMWSRRCTSSLSTEALTYPGSRAQTIQDSASGNSTGTIVTLRAAVNGLGLMIICRPLCVNCYLLAPGQEVGHSTVRS